MEHVLNWLVLLGTFGGIVVVAFVCCTDLMRRAEPSGVVVGDLPSAPAAAQQAVVSSTPEAVVRLNYTQGGQVLHTQVVGSDQPGFIGGVSFNGLGDGVPLRYVKIFWRDGAFVFSNEDWQAPLSVSSPSMDETDVPMGPVVPLEDGAQLHLMNGWMVECHIEKGGEQ